VHQLVRVTTLVNNSLQLKKVSFNYYNLYSTM